MLPPWDAEQLETTLEYRPALWQAVESATTSACWQHEIMCCARPAPTPPESAAAKPQHHYFYIHRFTLRPDLARPLNEMLQALARDELRDDAERPSEAASNVGGFHSSRDLCQRAAVASSALPLHLRAAVSLAADVEARQLGRAALPLPSEPDASTAGFESAALRWRAPLT